MKGIPVDISLATPLVRRREPFCIVGLPEEVVLSVVIVEDGIVIIVGVKVVKGILFCQFLCVTH